VQRLRREAGCDLADRIEVWVAGDAAVVAAAGRHAEYIAGETLAARVRVGEAVERADAEQVLELEGLTARLAIRRAAG
jgi:isoleucyl-tRNA synthetase